HTGTSATRTLLAPRLLGRVLDLLAVFLCAVTATCVCLICNDDLMNQRLVVVTAEHDIGCIHTRTFLTLCVQELKFHYFAPFFRRVLMAGVTKTLPPFAPGTAPLMSSSLRSVSIRAITRFCTVLVSSPM